MKDAIDMLTTELNRLQEKQRTTIRKDHYTIGYYNGSILATAYALKALGVNVRVNPSTLKYEVVAK